MKERFLFLILLFNNTMALDAGAIGGMAATGSVVLCLITKGWWLLRCTECADTFWDPSTNKCVRHCERKDVTCTCICKTCAEKTRHCFKKGEPITTQPRIQDPNALLRVYVSAAPGSPRSDDENSDDTVIIYHSDSESNLLPQQ